MSLSPVGLRCEYLSDPLGIDVSQPRLSWVLSATGRGERQSAYQVLVGSSQEAVEAGSGELWDTGKVADQDEGRTATLQVVYGGPELRSGQRAWWAVRVWDRDDVASLSPVAFWEMGLLEPIDWLGEWIGAAAQPVAEAAMKKERGLRPWEELNLPPSPYLRKGFELRGEVRRARLYATARGVYELRLNGERVGDGLLTPGWSDYRKRIRYQVYDVAGLLRDGANALGAILGTGWYSGNVGWYGQSEHYGPTPRLLAQLTVEYEDGTTETIATDGSWRTSTGPILASDMLMGETYDARRELTGWDQPGYDDAAWTPVETDAVDEVPLVADRAEPIRVLEDLSPVSIMPHPNGTTIVDMGQNMVGWVRLTAGGPAGTEIRLRFAEMLNPDGSIYTENLRSAHQTDTWILRGTAGRRDGGTAGDDEEFEPRFTFHGFRYVEVSGYPGELRPEAIVGRVIGSAAAPAGEFSCSNELVNAIQHAIVWGQRGNFVSIPTDCPQRDERLGWLADAQIFARTATCNADVAAFFTRWLEDIADGQSAEGGFPDVAPRLVNELDGAPAWGDGGVIMPWTVYQVYGDTRIIEERLDGAMAWVNFLEKHNPNLLWRNRRGNDYGDWLSIRAETSKELLATAYFAFSADLVSRMAEVVGREAEARRYRTLFERIKAAFNAAYVKEDGRILGETQTSYVLALRMNLLPEELREAAARYLVEDIERRGWLLSTGFVGVGYLLPTLTAAGQLDVAYKLLLQEDFPSWGYMIRHGATTIWERWDGWTEERGFQTPEMNSFNHYSLGSVGEWLYRSVAGIDLDPEQPGYAHVVIKPQPGGDLTSARATYRSVRGEISSAWEIADGAFTLRVTIPAGSTATIYVPTRDAVGVREGDGLASSADGVRHLRDEDRAAVFAVEAGEYEFRA